jgi:hypothetical protein
MPKGRLLNVAAMRVPWVAMPACEMFVLFLIGVPPVLLMLPMLGGGFGEGFAPVGLVAPLKLTKPLSL